METAGGTGSYWTAACLIAYSPLISEARSLNTCFSKGSPHPPHYCDRLAQLREPSCLVRARTEIGQSAAYEFFLRCASLQARDPMRCWSPSAKQGLYGARWFGCAVGA